MLSVQLPLPHRRQRGLKMGRVGCTLAIVLAFVFALLALRLYIRDPRNPLLSILTTGIGFLTSALVAFAFEKGVEYVWQATVGARTPKQEGAQWLEPAFDEVFKVMVATDLPSGTALLSIPYTELHNIERTSIVSHIVIVGPSGVGKTRQAVEIIRDIANRSISETTCILTPKRYPIVIPQSIPEDVARQHVILFLDDVQRIYQARSAEEWEAFLVALMAFFSHICNKGFTVLATLREPDFDKAYYPNSAIWNDFQKIQLRLLSDSAEERLIHSLSQYTGIELDALQAAEIAKINPGTCTDLINFFIKKRADGRKLLTREDVNGFKPDFWNKQVFPKLPHSTQSLFRAMALCRDLGLWPARDLVLLFAASLVDGLWLRNIYLVQKSVSALIDQGVVREADGAILCHDSYLDGKARTRVDAPKLAQLLQRIGHSKMLAGWETFGLGIFGKKEPRDKLSMEAQYALIQIADYRWRQQPLDAHKTIVKLEHHVTQSSVAGLLIQVLLKWESEDASQVASIVNRLSLSKNPMSRKAALYLARNLGLANVLSRATHELSTDVRRVGIEQTYLYWIECVEKGRSIELDTLANQLASRAILPIALLPHPISTRFLADLTLRLVARFFGTNNTGLVPLLHCWHQILSTGLLVDATNTKSIRSFRRKLRLSLIAWFGSWQIQRLLSNAFRPDHIVNLDIIDEWFHLTLDERQQWVDLLTLTQSGLEGTDLIRIQLIRLSQDTRPLFAVLAIPALVSNLKTQSSFCLEIAQAIFSTDNALAWTIGLRGLTHGVELGVREPNLRLRIYQLMKAQVLKMWRNNKFREARFDTILWPILVRVWGENDADEPVEFANELYAELSESDSVDATGKKQDLIKCIENLALNRYPKMAVATLVKWYAQEQPIIRMSLIDTLISIGNVYPSEVQELLLRLGDTIDVRKVLSSLAEESTTKAMQLDIAGPLLIALFGDANLRKEWLAALSEDMLASRSFAEALRKMLYRVLNLLGTSKILGPLPRGL